MEEKTIIAELSVVPLGMGPSVSAYVKKALKELSKDGLKIKVCPMGTIIEARDMDSILSAVKRAHETLFEAAAPRVLTSLRIDDRRDKEISMDSKLRAVTE